MSDKANLQLQLHLKDSAFPDYEIKSCLKQDN